MQYPLHDHLCNTRRQKHSGEVTVHGQSAWISLRIETKHVWIIHKDCLQMDHALSDTKSLFILTHCNTVKLFYSIKFIIVHFIYWLWIFYYKTQAFNTSNASRQWWHTALLLEWLKAFLNFYMQSCILNKSKALNFIANNR